ncbi:MAG: hypothetical protein EBT40_02110 [Betaproteobacteria bacterium]|nr:hypothetical protein [Betaproteobacteria bacterium]
MISGLAQKPDDKFGTVRKRGAVDGGVQLWRLATARSIPAALVTVIRMRRSRPKPVRTDAQM